jgi:hypothetical protein
MEGESMERLEELLEELVYHTRDAAAERARGNGSFVEEREVDEIHMAIIDHVTSLVEAARKEGGGNG